MIEIGKESSSQYVFVQPKKKSRGPNGEKLFKKWTHTQNILYAQFLSQNRQEFESYKERRSLNFYNKMAQHLQIGKSNIQCRSHHQKMLSKFKDVEGIISGIFSQAPNAYNKDGIEKTLKIEEKSEIYEHHPTPKNEVSGLNYFQMLQYSYFFYMWAHATSNFVNQNQYF